MSQLFSPYTLRDIIFKNRIAVSPMSQYRAIDGYANDWHMVHLGRFAMGGAGLVYTEATAVEQDGRRTHGDLGLWRDDQVDHLSTIAAFLSNEGAVPGIQLSHAGRKASERRPWHGESPVNEDDIALRNEAPWTAIAPSPVTYADGWPDPQTMSPSDIERVIKSFGEAARRANEAGFKVIEVYAAHGFLVHQFLSPIANQRSDEWGGSPEKRLRFAVEVAKSIRNKWPDEYPLIFRLSATDWLENGLEIEDIIHISKNLKVVGVDMIDCSTGGISGRERPRRMTLGQGFQVPFAQQIKKEANIPSMAVGMLWDANVCERIIANGEADMIAMARELLEDPNWPLHAANKLSADQDHNMWPEESGWWLMKRNRLLSKLGISRT
jgi:2,4-dienoyl-CoA reductase-like NADH-dependent reductase (Old Yellow Enzyme family)